MFKFHRLYKILTKKKLFHEWFIPIFCISIWTHHQSKCRVQPLTGIRRSSKCHNILQALLVSTASCVFPMLESTMRPYSTACTSKLLRSLTAKFRRSLLVYMNCWIFQSGVTHYYLRLEFWIVEVFPCFWNTELNKIQKLKHNIN